MVKPDPQSPTLELSALTCGWFGRGVGVVVAVVDGVSVGTVVSVGVAVAPSGANALKPLVMHGRNPSA
jgi:hypothetical protein